MCAPLADAALRADWAPTMRTAYGAFCAAVQADAPTLLDPYAAQAPDEFFAVASEAFFVSPAAFTDAHPELYRLFQRYYRQDPLRDTLAVAA
jgi:MtfA peptidase